MNIWSDIIVPGLAVLGAGLGAVNGYFSLRDRWHRVQVIPQWAFYGEWGGLSIQVVNRSAFAITVSDVGFMLRGETRRVTAQPLQTSFTRSLPWTLGPREAATLHFNAAELQSLRLGEAYAELITGERFMGDSEAIRQFRRDFERR